MSTFNNRNTIIVMALTFIIYCPQTQAMILAASCLMRRITPKTTHKIVLLYDQHDLFEGQKRLDHVNDIRRLIDIVETNKTETPFFAEIAEIHLNSSCQSNIKPLPTPSNAVKALALTTNMRHKNITFIPFDIRTMTEYLVVGILSSRKTYDAFANAHTNHELSSPFDSITPNIFLNHLNKRHKSVVDIIDTLPLLPNTRKNDFRTSQKHYDKCYTLMHSLLKKYNIDGEKNHIFNLIGQLQYSETALLHLTLAIENCFSVDVHLLKDLLHFSANNPLCIVLAGAYHSNNIEKRLLSYYEGFEKDLISSMTLPDSNFDDLSNVTYPRHVPHNFLSEQMKRFLATE